MSTANNRQVAGQHYRITPGEQHWDRVRRLGLDYFQAQITRYVERWKLKNGLEDLHKAQHFLQKYIELNTPAEKVPAEKTSGPHGPQQLNLLVEPDPPKEEFWHCVQCRTSLVCMDARACSLRSLQDTGHPQPQGYVDQDR